MFSEGRVKVTDNRNRLGWEKVEAIMFLKKTIN